MDVTKKWLIQFDDRGNNYLSVLNARFKRNLEEMPPDLLFETYGTHYIFSAVLGGRADFTSHTTMTKKITDSLHAIGRTTTRRNGLS